jgi:hypothetical protein
MGMTDFMDHGTIQCITVAYCIASLTAMILYKEANAPWTKLLQLLRRRGVDFNGDY